MARKQIRVWAPKHNKIRLGFLSRRMLLTWFLLAGLIFLFAPARLTNKFQFAFTRIFHWPLSIGRNISLSVHTRQPLTNLVSRREHIKVQNYAANLQEQLYQARQKVDMLSGLRNRFGLEGADLVPADVITASVSGPQNELIINRGQKDGIASGQFVLGINNIIGTISEVGSRDAKVKLITDPTSSIEAKIAGLKVIIKGNGNNSAKIPLIARKKHKIRVGDIVYARKKPGLLDTPMIIGTVTQCKTDDEDPQLWDITVEPACDIETLNSVAVLIMNPEK